MKKEKYAYTTSYLLGTTAVAAPVFNHKKELVASITIVGVTATMNIAKDSILIRKRVIKECSRNIGTIRILTVNLAVFSYRYYSILFRSANYLILIINRQKTNNRTY